MSRNFQVDFRTHPTNLQDYYPRQNQSKKKKNKCEVIPDLPTRILLGGRLGNRSSITGAPGVVTAITTIVGITAKVVRSVFGLIEI